MKTYTKKRFSRIRKSIAAYMRIARQIPTTHIQSKVAVPGLHAFCKKHGVTYTPVIMKAIASVTRKHPVINSIYARDLLFQENMYYYDDVDMSLAIEKHDMGMDYATFAVIRKVNKRSIHDIHKEIKIMAALPHYKMPDAFIRLILVELMPNVIKAFSIRCVAFFPWMYRHFFGTMGLSNLGKYGLAQFDTLFINNFGFAVGGIETVPVTKNGETRMVPMLNITQTSNHCVADGAESARVMEAVKRVFESGDYIRICEENLTEKTYMVEKRGSGSKNQKEYVSEKA